MFNMGGSKIGFPYILDRGNLRGKVNNSGRMFTITRHAQHTRGIPGKDVLVSVLRGEFGRVFYALMFEYRGIGVISQRADYVFCFFMSA